MKRLLSIIGAISLVGTSTLGVISCKSPYADGERHNIGNWKEVYPIDFPFKEINNNYYLTIWRISNSDKWKASLFKYSSKSIIISTLNQYQIEINSDNTNWTILALLEVKNNKKYIIKNWEHDIFTKEYFKYLYKWDNNSIPTIPNIDDNGNIII